SPIPDAPSPGNRLTEDQPLMAAWTNGHLRQLTQIPDRQVSDRWPEAKYANERTPAGTAHATDRAHSSRKSGCEKHPESCPDSHQPIYPRPLTGELTGIRSRESPPLSTAAPRAQPRGFRMLWLGAKQISIRGVNAR